MVALPALLLPFVIRAAVVEGVATATEVSTIGIVYARAGGLLIYRQFDWQRLYPMLLETASLSGAILLIIGTATGMAWALTQSGFSRQTWPGSWPRCPAARSGFLVVSIVAFVVLGSVLEGIPAIVLFGPLLFPIARRVGIHEVHYAMVVILAMGIGLFAPPFGVGYYTACAIGASRRTPGCGGSGPISARCWSASWWSPPFPGSRQGSSRSCRPERSEGPHAGADKRRWGWRQILRFAQDDKELEPLLPGLSELPTAPERRL